MAEYLILDLQATGSSVTQVAFRGAINGCRPRQDYQYNIIFITARHAVVAFNDAYSLRTFEGCVNNNLERDNGELAGLTVVHESDLGSYSQTVRQQIEDLVEQIQGNGNTVEGFDEDSDGG